MNLFSKLFTRSKPKQDFKEGPQSENSGAEVRSRARVSLGFAAASGNPDLVEAALAEKPDVNMAEGPSGFTPMLSAVAGTDGVSRQKIIRLLHAAGADIEKKDTEKGLTPLHYAALRSKPLIMELCAGICKAA